MSSMYWWDRLGCCTVLYCILYYTVLYTTWGAPPRGTARPRRWGGCRPRCSCPGCRSCMPDLPTISYRYIKCIFSAPHIHLHGHGVQLVRGLHPRPPLHGRHEAAGILHDLRGQDNNTVSVCNCFLKADKMGGNLHHYSCAMPAAGAPTRCCMPPAAVPSSRPWSPGRSQAPGRG